jgi:hypothetical protein
MGLAGSETVPLALSGLAGQLIPFGVDQAQTTSSQCREISLPVSRPVLYQTATRPFSFFIGGLTGGNPRL